jgi:hypothetical protein
MNSVAIDRSGPDDDLFSQSDGIKRVLRFKPQRRNRSFGAGKGF